MKPQAKPNITDITHNEAGLPIVVLPGRKYIVVSRMFDGVNASGCPCVGQIATNNRLLAYFLYHKWYKFSMKHEGYTIAVMLLKRNKKGTYDAIKR